MTYQAKHSLKKVRDASFCKTFPLFLRSYQKVVTNQWKIKWAYLMNYQAKLIEEGSW